MKFSDIIFAIFLPLFFSCAAFAQLKNSFYDMEIPAGMEDSAALKMGEIMNIGFKRSSLFMYLHF